MKFFVINEKLIKKTRLYFLTFVIIVLIASIYLLRNNQWIQIIYGFVVEWKRGIYLLLETGKTWGEFLMISTVGNFGWLDTPMNFSIVGFVFFVAFLLSILQTKGSRSLKKWDYVVLIVTVICLCLFTTIALTNHTIKTILFGSEFADGTYDIRTALYQIPYVGGLQGRYYLPFAFLFFIPLPQKLQIKGKIVHSMLYIIEILLYTYVFFLLIQRYWS